MPLPSWQFNLGNPPEDLAGAYRALENLRFALDRFSMVAVTDRFGVITDVNERFSAVSGYSRKELIGKTLQVVDSGNHPEWFWLEMWRTVMQGQVWHGDVCHRTRDQRLYWVETTLVPLKDASGTVQQCVAIHADITSRKKTEKELHELHQRLHRIAAQVPGVVYQYLLKPDGTSSFPYASEGVREIFRVRPDEIQASSDKVFAVVHPEDRKPLASSIFHSAETLTPWQFEYRISFPGEDVRWVYGNARPIRQSDGSVLWHGFASDVTEQKQARDEIQSTRMRLQAVINASTHVSIISTDLAGTITLFNTGAERMLGYSADEMVGKRTPLLFHLESEIQERSRELTESLRRPVTGLDVFVEVARLGIPEDREWTYVRKDGLFVIVNQVVTATTSEQGEITGYLSVATDITGRKRAEVELTRRREIAERLALIARRTSNAVLVTSREGRIEWVNDAFIRMTGFTLEEVSGRKPGEILQGPNTNRQESRRIAAALRKGESVQAEVLNYAKSGRTYWNHVEIDPLRDEHGEVTGFMAIETDVTERRLAQEAIAAEQARLAAFVEHTPAAIAMFDRDMRYMAVSRRWISDYRLEGQTIIGRSHYDVFPNIPERWRLVHRRCLTGAVENNENDVWTNGDSLTKQHLRWEVRPWYLMEGCIGGLMMFTEDITALKNAEAALRESKDRFELAVRGSCDGIWDWNMRTGQVFYSPRFKELLGYSGSEFPHRFSSFFRRLHPDDLLATKQAFRRHLSKQVAFEVVHRLQTKSGEWRWFRSRGEAVRDNGKPYRMAGSISDVTDMRAKEAELTRSLLDIEESHKRIAAQATQLLVQSEKLQEAKSLAEAASLSKSAFLANMSHEIRTPMTAILGFADLLADPDLTDEERLSHVSTIKNSGEHLLTIINDILDLSKIEVGKMTVERIAMVPQDLANEVISVLQLHATGKGLELSVQFAGPQPKVILSDPVRVRQILMNLVGNAIKFTEIGKVTLIVRMSPIVEGGESLIEFEIQDTGIGMSKEQIQQLFQPFSQADISTTRKFGGTGLGLTICQRMAQLLGGGITVSSEPGQGSTFVVSIATGMSAVPSNTTDLTVPSGRLETCQVPTPAAVQVRTQLSGRILLAEDGPINQRLLKFLLAKQGAEVDIAENGRIAVQKCLGWDPLTEEVLPTRETYQLILMDMQMPEVDGYQATRILREKGYTGSIIAITAHAMVEDRKKCLDCGCDDYLSKPIDRDQLLNLCQRWMSRESYLMPKPALSEGQFGTTTVEIHSCTEMAVTASLCDKAHESRPACSQSQIFAEPAPVNSAAPSSNMDTNPTCSLVVKLIEQAQKALDNRDFWHLSDLARSLRSPENRMQNTAFVDATERLEECCLEGDPNVAQMYLNRIEEALRAVQLWESLEEV